MLEYKLKAMLTSLLKNKKFWNGALVAFAFFSFNMLFPFYPLPVVLFLSIFLGYVGYNVPQLAMVLQLVLCLFPVSYQSVGMGWYFMLTAALVLIILTKDYIDKSEYSERNWKIVAIIQMMVGLSFFSGIWAIFILPFFVISSFYLSSKRVAPVLFIILTIAMLFVSFGNQSELYPISQVENKLIFNKPELGIDINIISEVMLTANDIFMESSQIGKVGGSLVGNLINIILNDNYIYVMLLWIFPLTIMAYIPGRVRMKRELSLSSLLIFVIPLGMYFVWGILSVFVWASAVLSLFIVFVLERKNVKLSREEEVVLKEREKKFMQFGLKELTAAKEVESLDDVGNYEDVKEELKESITIPLLHKDLVEAYGIRPARGMLLFGPPGTGKTLIMTALAKEIDYGFFYVRSSSLTSPAFGVAAKNITNLFKTARQNQPCILFFDEIDSLGRKRENLSEHASKMLTSLLQEMDGFKDDEKIVIIGATNKPEVLDPALMRPGRIDKIIYMPPPNKEGRKKIFEIHTKKLNVEKLNIEELASKTNGFSGADIKILCEEVNRSVAKKAIKSKKVIKINNDDFVRLIRNMEPSIKEADILKYNRFKSIYERRFIKSEGEESDEIVDMGEVLDAVEKGYEENLNMLLFGPKGNGKSLAVKHFAKIKNIPLSKIDCSKEEFDPNVLKVVPGEILVLERLEEAPPKYIKKIIALIDKKNVFATSVKPWLINKELLAKFEVLILVGLPNPTTRKKLLDRYSVYEESIVRALSGCTYSEVMKIGGLIRKQKMMGKIKNIELDEDIHIILSHANKVNVDNIKLYKRFVESVESKKQG
ncbi:AAA family ATPase [Candidatus Micrarchaeota archaeon]|nr:AAA family ATPase [Candidatus Micrarchaeota archaeon]